MVSFFPISYLKIYIEILTPGEPQNIINVTVQKNSPKLFKIATNIFVLLIHGNS